MIISLNTEMNNLSNGLSHDPILIKNHLLRHHAHSRKNQFIPQFYSSLYVIWGIIFMKAIHIEL